MTEVEILEKIWNIVVENCNPEGKELVEVLNYINNLQMEAQIREINEANGNG